MLASGRDFIYTTTFIKNKEDGTIINCGSSIEHDDYPPLKKYVRGDAKLNGWRLEPDKEN